MAADSKCFTKKYTNKAIDIKTTCGISAAYDPSTGAPHPKIVNFTGLWDTGATKTCITKNVADALGLKSVNQVKAYHAGGHNMCNLYIVNIILPNGVGFMGLPVIEANLTGTDVLLGMDVITSGDFAITNVGGKTTFSFRMPSEKEIDYLQITQNEKERALNPKSHSNQTRPKKKRK